VSNISQSIDEIINLGPGPLLKTYGFSKSGRTFHRKSGNAWQVVNVQASTSNTGVNSKFTINLGVYHPAIAELAGKSIQTEKPKEYECIVRERIGKLLPTKLDYWWEITPATNLEYVAQTISSIIKELGIPWLEVHSSIQQIAQALSAQPSIMSAAAALALQDKSMARQRIIQMIMERPMAASAARQWAQKQGLEGID
jgi:hypothetical protein